MTFGFSNFLSEIFKSIMKGKEKVGAFVDVPREYCPEAVVDWYNMGKQEDYKSKLQNSELREKARKHLSAMGWRFWHKDKGLKYELRYDSPNGKTYMSLRTACKACIDEGGVSESVGSNSPSDHDDDHVNTSNVNKLVSGEEKRTAEQSRTAASRKRSNRDQSSCAPETCKKRRHKEVESYSSSLRKGKALKDIKTMRDERELELSERKVALRQSRIPTTIHSLLDNNVVLPMARVYYRSKKSKVPPLATGKITRDGIVCDCCSDVFALSAFEKHAGSTNHRPAANIILEDGRSLMECNLQLKASNAINMVKDRKHSDDICSVCKYTGELVICDRCPSTFHPQCVGLSELPDGEWICPSCCCGVCGLGNFEEKINDQKIFVCDQCELNYHTNCVRNHARRGNGKRFCSTECENINLGLRKIIGKPIPVGHNNLTWTLLKPKGSSGGGLAKNNGKINVALSVMHECFEPVKDHYNNRDLAKDVLFNGASDLRRLNFRGFYTVILEKGGDVTTVATVRIHGKSVAEVPLIGTKFQYRRLGMCRVLMNELENQLSLVGVEKLTLPAISTTLKTWTSSFGFSQITNAERLQLLKYTFLDFPDTVMCQKFLKKSSPSLQNQSSAISVVTQVIEIED